MSLTLYEENSMVPITLKTFCIVEEDTVESNVSPATVFFIVEKPRTSVRMSLS